MKFIKLITYTGIALLIYSGVVNATTFSFEERGGSTTSNVGSEGHYENITFTDSGTQVNVRAGRSSSNLNSVSSFSNYINRHVYWDFLPANGGLGNVATSGMGSDNFNANLGNNSARDEILFFDFLSDFTLEQIFFNGSHRERLAPNRTPRFHLFTSDSENGTYYSVGGALTPINREYLDYNVTSQYFALAITGPNGGSGYVEALRGTTPVPEPTTILLFGVGLAGLIGVSKIRKKAIS